MGKRRSFEDILNAEFRWPKQGDKPFVVAEDQFENANIAGDGFTPFVLMMEGYKETADLMIAASANDRPMRDVLVFPIIFNYRQFLELALKYQIATFGPAVGIEPVWNTHFLDRLCEQFLEMLERYGTEDPDEADRWLAKLSLNLPRSTRIPVLTAIRLIGGAIRSRSHIAIYTCRPWLTS